MEHFKDNLYLLFFFHAVLLHINKMQQEKKMQQERYLFHDSHGITGDQKHC